MYYAFYAPEKNKPWTGEIELRGLKSGKYEVADYETGRHMGQIEASSPKMSVTFAQHLLLEASPR